MRSYEKQWKTMNATVKIKQNYKTKKPMKQTLKNNERLWIIIKRNETQWKQWNAMEKQSKAIKHKSKSIKTKKISKSIKTHKKQSTVNQHQLKSIKINIDCVYFATRIMKYCFFRGADLWGHF